MTRKGDAPFRKDRWPQIGYTIAYRLSIWGSDNEDQACDDCGCLTMLTYEARACCGALLVKTCKECWDAEDRYQNQVGFQHALHDMAHGRMEPDPKLPCACCGHEHFFKGECVKTLCDCDFAQLDEGLPFIRVAYLKDPKRGMMIQSCCKTCADKLSQLWYEDRARLLGRDKRDRPVKITGPVDPMPCGPLTRIRGWDTDPTC